VKDTPPLLAGDKPKQALAGQAEGENKLTRLRLKGKGEYISGARQANKGYQRDGKKRKPEKEESTIRLFQRNKGETVKGGI